MGYCNAFLLLILVATEASPSQTSSLRHLSVDGRLELRDIQNNRPGQASTNHSCDRVSAVPQHLRLELHMAPNGLDNFYQKYTETYGIPIVGSSKVPDGALQSLCYIVRFMLADIGSVRDSVYARYGRFAVLAQAELTTDIPEHSHLEPKSFWNSRRGLGATTTAPVCSVAEENLLCYRSDPYWGEDIGLHEVAHGIHSLGLSYVNPGFDTRLKTAYESAKQKGTWSNTYAETNMDEYWAEGVQSYFNANMHRASPDGIHNEISNNMALKYYDPSLYSLIEENFCCNNTYIQRCPAAGESLATVRGKEKLEILQMDCRATAVAGCTDANINCPGWARAGECSVNPGYMLQYCKNSCNKCCSDDNGNCATWARANECTKNPGYMLVNCKRSCNTC